MVSTELAGNCLLKERFAHSIIDTADIPAIQFQGPVGFRRGINLDRGDVFCGKSCA